MDAKLFQMLLSHPKARRLSDFDWENAYSPNTDERLRLVASISREGQPLFKLLRSPAHSKEVVEDVSPQEVGAAIVTGKPWIATIVKSRGKTCRVVESPEEKTERFILESISFGNATLSATYERVMDGGAENEEHRLLLRTPNSRPKQRDFPLAVAEIAAAISQGESLLAAALRMIPAAEDLLLSEDAEIFSIAEASALRKASENPTPKRGRSTL